MHLNRVLSYIPGQQDGTNTERDKTLREQLIGEIRGLNYFQTQIDVTVQQLTDEQSHGDEHSNSNSESE